RRIDPRPPIAVGRAAVPVLYAFAQVTDPQALCLIPDDAQGGRLATDHLLRTGRRRLAHVTGPRHFECVRARQEGMEQALREHGLDLLPAHQVYDGPWREAWGYEAATRLLDADP